MATFQFRLDRVLQWYRTQLQLEESRMAACLAALNLIEQRIAGLQAERLSIERDVISGGPLLARDLASLGFYRLRAKKETAAMDEDRVRRERTLQNQRAVVQAAQRRVKLVEKLRDRRLSEHHASEDRALESLAAESYLSKWIAAKRTT